MKKVIWVLIGVSLSLLLLLTAPLAYPDALKGITKQTKTIIPQPPKPNPILIQYPEPPDTFPFKLKLFIISECNRRRVPYLLVFRFITRESQWDIRARGYNFDKKGKIVSTDYGLMQINSSNIVRFIKWYRDPKRSIKSYDPIHNPYDNVELGIKHLRDLYNYLKDWKLVAEAYNGGLDRVRNNNMKDSTKDYADFIVPYPDWWEEPDGVQLVRATN